MASFIQNWWDKHEMDKDGKGCALGCMLVAVLLMVAGGSLVAFAFWAAILL